MSDIFVKIVQRMKKRETTQCNDAKTQSATDKHSSAHESNHVRHVKKVVNTKITDIYFKRQQMVILRLCVGACVRVCVCVTQREREIC